MTKTIATRTEGASPAFLSHGFRPFFLGGAVWAALAMVIWLLVLTGNATVPTALDAVSWHAHEFLFGYLSAVIAGFLLTAVPNWTGRLPIRGWTLLGLSCLWLAGRVVIALSRDLPAIGVAVVDLLFPIVLGSLILREIIAAGNWRNLIILAVLAAFALGNAVFHWEAAEGVYAAAGHGLRIGLGAGIMLIAVVGGRIIPAFTRSWLIQAGYSKLPTPPMQGFDKASLLILLVSLLFWVAAPEAQITGGLLILTGALHLRRLARWRGYLTLSAPLVAVLHVGYLFLPIGALAIGLEVIFPSRIGMATAQHLWMGGAIGLMTLAVMTRASLGHTGRDPQAGVGTLMIYASLTTAVLARVCAGLWPEYANGLHAVSALFWTIAFAGFATIYGPMLIRPRRQQGD